MEKIVVLESLDLNEYIDDPRFNILELKSFSSRGFEGDVLTNAALVTLSTATITALAKIIIELIKNRKKPKLSYRGNGVEFEAEDIDIDKVKSIILEVQNSESEDD